MNNQESVTLLQLQEFIRRVLALNLPDPLWVEAEISEISSSRGHRYFSLIYKEPGADEPSAAGNAVIWNGQWNQLQKKHGEKLLRELSQPGVLIRMKARVEFHERYGLKLIVEDLDPTYTFGLWDLQRKQVLERLQKEGLPGRNAALRLPLVPQRIAVISTEQGAGYQDFINHLQENAFGYKFHPTLFPAVVQGARTAPEIVEKLAKIEQLRENFDCTVIIRGGGSKVDLSAFDHYDICKAIAFHPLPVLTGIGHDVDESLADKVAYQALKTPTAVADFMIHRILDYENAIIQAGISFQAISRDIIGKQEFRLEQFRISGSRSAIQAIASRENILELLSRESGKLFKFMLHEANIRLDALHQLGVQLNPATLLKKGYSITLKHGQTSLSISDFQVGDEIETIVSNGRIYSTITKTSEHL